MEEIFELNRVVGSYRVIRVLGSGIYLFIYSYVLVLLTKHTIKNDTFEDSFE